MRFALPRFFRRLAFASALACAAVAARAQTPVEGSAQKPINSFVRISDDEGLAHSDVRAIAQDHEGFLWFGLRLGGLTRYDGYELTTHQHDPANPKSLGHQIIWSLLVDHEGTLWIGTEGGLDRYDRSTDSFIHYRHDAERNDSLSNNVVTALFEDHQGRLWVATRDGLCRLDDREQGRFSRFYRPQVLPRSAVGNTFRAITEDPETGLLWLGATDGIAAFDPRTGAFASYLHDPKDPESLSHNSVNKVVRDAGGVFWALTEHGLNRFEPKIDRVPANQLQQPRLTFRRFVQPAGDSGPGVNFLRDGLVDHRGRLWLASRGGLLLFDRDAETFTVYHRDPSDPNSLSDDLTQGVFEDRSHNIWVATFGGGVDRLRSEAKPFVIYRHRPGDHNSISEDRIVGLGFDPKGNLWAATTNGLNRFDGARWTRFLHRDGDPESIPSNDLATVAVAPSGDVWIGTNYGGLYRYDGERFHTYHTSPTNAPAPNGWQLATGAQVNSILPNADGSAWLGVRSYGLDFYRDGRFLHFNPQPATPQQPAQPTTNPLLGVYTDDGALWFATETSGLSRYDPQTQSFSNYPTPVERPGLTRSILCIAGDKNGVIWLGAADGILKFDTTERRFVGDYSPTDRNNAPAIMTIVPDRRGHVWAGASAGLLDFDPVTTKFRVYEKPDGLPSNVFSQRTGALGPDGRVYFGTRNGLVAFDPQQLRDNPNPPPVVLTEFRWLGAHAPLQTGSHRDELLNVGDKIVVPPGQLGFTLKFSALDFSAPEKNRFRYRLEGWETEWRSTSWRERSATYTSLPPGSYTFHVQASNPDQVWNETGASVLVVVQPHVWQTPWFRVLTALGAFLVVIGGIQWRLRAARARNALLAEQVSERTAQLREEIAVREKAQAELRELNAGLERRVEARTAELARMNEELQGEIAERKNIEAQLRHSQKMEAIGQLAGGVAHDFNNLLTVILGQSELLSDAHISSEARDAALRDLNAAAQRATNLTRQLLVFSRRQSMSPIAVDLNQVVSGVSKLLRHVIGERIQLETRLAPAPIGVLADPGMLEQVLLNMAVNARDEMPRGGRLTISTASVDVGPDQVRDKPNAGPGLHARFSVADTGTGIPPHILPHIFEPFFTTKESGKGTGLGLAISLGIVQQHKGWIEVETAPNKGATFHVYLPLHALAPSPAPVAASAAPKRKGGATILLAEDESAVRAVVKHVLTRQGHRVIEASSGAEALARWAETRDEITLLLTDIVMPGWPDGHELAAKLSSDQPSLRVITMSGYDPNEVANRGSNAKPHLRKPFTAEDLVRAIDAALRGDTAFRNP